RVRLEAIVRARERKEAVRHRRSEHGVKVAICNRVILGEGPVIPELPTIVVAHGSVPQTIRLRLRDRCEEIVGTAMVRLYHRSPAVGQIRGPVHVDPMWTHRASPTVGQRDGSW